MTSSQAARWNRTVGRRVGRQHRTPAETKRASRRTGNAVTQSRYRRATQIVPKRDRARGTGSATLSTQSGVDDAFDRVLDELTADWQNTADQQAVTTRVVEEAQEEGGDGWLDRLGNTQVAGIAGDVLGGVMNSPVGTALYNAGRLPNALFQGLENLAERDTSVDRGFLEEGGNIWNAFAGGVGEGAQYGAGASGFGQVYEALKENPSSYAHAPLTALEEAHPALEQALAIGVGAAGEIGLDPYNVVAPAVPSILRSTGTRLTRQGLTEAVQAAGRQGIADGLASAPATFNRSPLAPDMIASRAEAALDDTLLNSVLDVSRGGAPHARTLGGDMFPSLVRERWLQSVIDSISGEADEAVQRLVNDPQRMTVGNINARRAASKDFDDFWTKLTDSLQNDPNYGPAMTGSVDEVIAILKGNAGNLANPKSLIGGMIADNWEIIRNEHFVQLQPYADQVYKAVENPTTRSVGIRIGTKKSGRVVPVPVVGRAFAFAGDTLGQLPGVKGIGNFLYEKQFPGLFANKISRASAYGVRGLDNFVRDLEKLAKGFTPEEAKDLFKAMGDHTSDFGGRKAASGASMDDALDWLRKAREERFIEELREGARSIDDATGKSLPGKQFDPNYQYLHLKGGTKNKRLQFNKERADQFKNHGNYVGYGIEDAKAWGLRPIDDAFQAMQLHYMDSANKITKSYFWHDIAANYGLMPNATATGISNTEMTARGLREVQYGKLSAAFKQATKDSGGKFYIPNAMHDLASEFDKMMDWTTAKMGRFGRTFNKIINQFKLWTTLPYPGFHVRNFMGDTAMGLLDGVRPTKYLEVMKKYAASRAGRAANFEILPGHSMTFKQLMQQFRLEANSSYLKIDVGMTTTKTAGRIAGIGRTIGKKARNISDDRELLPRFAHYTEALQQEAKALWNSGLRDVDDIMAKAKDAALWRVNHYKFDYNALLPWERSLKAMAFPFYTYTRKAIPTLLEQMFINPHYFQMTNRWMMDNDGSAADAFNYMNMPQFWRDFGYGMLTDEAEPLAMTGEILPTNVLDILSSNSLGEAARDVISTSNPAFQIPYELASGNRAFDDREIQGGVFDYAMSKIPFVGDIQENFSNVLPGGSTNPISEEDDWTRFIRNRLGLGIPIRRASEGEQERQAEANFDIAADEPVTQYNYGQDRFTIQMRPGGLFQVTDKYTSEPIGPMFPTPQAAIEWAMSSLPAPVHENVPLVNRPPNLQDVMKVLQSQ